MNKPKKKEGHWCDGQYFDDYKEYNQACNDWEKWLPSEEEIRIELEDSMVWAMNCWSECERLSTNCAKDILNRQVKAISRRLNG